MKLSQYISKAKDLVAAEKKSKTHQWDWGKLVHEAEQDGALPTIEYDNKFSGQKPALKKMIEEFARMSGYQGDPQTVYQWYRTYLAWPEGKRKNMHHSVHQILKNVPSRFDLPPMTVDEARQYKGHKLQDRSVMSLVSKSDKSAQIKSSAEAFIEASKSIRKEDCLDLTSAEVRVIERNCERLSKEIDKMMSHTASRRPTYLKRRAA